MRPALFRLHPVVGCIHAWMPGAIFSSDALVDSMPRILMRRRETAKLEFVESYYFRFSFAKSQLTKFHHASTYFGRALR